MSNDVNNLNVFTEEYYDCDHVWIAENVDSNVIKLVCKNCGSIIYRRVKEEPNSVSECSHEWRVTHYYEVDECLGLICKKCGKLSCACSLSQEDYEDWSNITNYEEGDEAYARFYKKGK